MSDDETTSSDELELAEALALLEREPVAPASLRARLVATVSATHRWDDLETEVARLLDLDRVRAGALLVGIDDAASWEPGPASEVAIYHVSGGPAVASAVTGFVRLAAGASFPEHQHLGDEEVLVLQGAFRDGVDGSVARRGDVVTMRAGTTHSFEAIGPLPLVYLVIARDGVRIGDEVIGPDDPRG